MVIILQNLHALLKSPRYILLVRCLLILITHSSIAQSSFVCESDAYLVQGSNNLYRHNPKTRVNTLIKSAILPDNNLNALGYNQVDNYLWGQYGNTNKIVRIANDGSYVEYAVSGLPAVNYQLGDVSPSGVMYLYSATNATTGYRINLAAGPPYVATSFTLSSNWLANCRDWAFNPRDGQLYTVTSANGNLNVGRINPATGAMAGLGTTGLSGDAYGQIYFDNAGNLYLNGETTTYRITRPDLGNFQPDVFATGNTRTAYGSGSDMARCTTTPLAATQPTFNCADGKSYLFQQAPTVAFEYDLTTGTTTPMNGGNPLISDTNINAIGFNPVDNYIWGSLLANSTYPNHIVRVGSDYSTEIFLVTDLPGGFNTGDVGLDGILYLRNNFATQFYKVDLNPTSTNYLKAIAVATTAPNLADWAVSPIDQKLYSVAADNVVYRIDPTTGVTTSLGTATGLETELASSFGAVFMDNIGNLYISSNTSGNIFKIADPSTGNTAAQLLSPGPSSGLNDGARCANSILGPGANDDTINANCSAVDISILENDVSGSAEIVVASTKLINPSNLTPATTVEIPGQGTYVLNTITGVVTFTPVDGFEGKSTIDYTIVDLNNLEAQATITVTADCPLPVKMVHFTAKRENETTHLSWATTEETNSNRFEIQRSQNGKIWNSIGTVAAKGAGSMLLNYSFVDPAPVNGENLYRLRMIDNDNTFSYSRIESLTFESEILTYPNPVSDNLLVKNYSEVKEIILYNSAGMKVLQSNTVTGDGIDVEHIPAGIYIVSLRFRDGNIHIHKVAIVK